MLRATWLSQGGSQLAISRGSHIEFAHEDQTRDAAFGFVRRGGKFSFRRVLCAIRDCLPRPLCFPLIVCDVACIFTCLLIFVFFIFPCPVSKKISCFLDLFFITFIHDKTGKQP
ncbi:hypothetical protein E2C01_071759 [Portunus trituberculatus]|uniref:Transmembrane protein n=1 Tax=Portunus trituberculatus TaxID=210409 RepID=A0A5B7I8V6_PORTR|nr:hypothetical protein [Portunus trituberculatus]